MDEFGNAIMATCNHIELPHQLYVCSHCKELTAYIEVNFCVPLHPGVCTDTVWDHYVVALYSDYRSTTKDNNQIGDAT